MSFLIDYEGAQRQEEDHAREEANRTEIGKEYLLHISESASLELTYSQWCTIRLKVIPCAPRMYSFHIGFCAVVLSSNSRLSQPTADSGHGHTFMVVVDQRNVVTCGARYTANT